MKQADFAMIVLITSMSLVVSYFVGTALIGGESSRNVQVEVVESISGDFPQPDEAIFNSKAINLTETINIGGSNPEDSPFSSDGDE